MKKEEPKAEIVIDGTTYVIKETQDKKNLLQNHSFMDGANVAMLHFDRQQYSGEEEEVTIKALDMKFRRLGKEDVLTHRIGTEIYELPNGTRVSKEYVLMGHKIFCELMGGKKNKLSFYVYASIDDKGETSKDRPVMIGKEYAYWIVAPRVSD